MVMSDYDQRPNYVKDTKLVALMFGGLGYFYTDRQTDRQTDVVLNNIKERAAAPLVRVSGTGGAVGASVLLYPAVNLKTQTA